ncbi:hypothetical protein FGK63_09730 [Ruegeria sediminis]|uniref:Invasion associated locus B family protein n=1 Tax=Ruegeria sediminis TaxID=2583820 RepID=A0ABY2WXZ1_9RHOB|nr:invasion associated locus B family protein [Ruegeria sediminis]TMV07737.1 hypothetical protein FGK63_09730 [Ruegeria sediminis]
MRWILVFLFLVSPALAQDMQGNDTPGNWRVTHHQIFGIWNSMCDEREESGALRQRCYIRRVDVFSPRPNFAAQFLFITPEPSGFKVAFGMEPGTLFSPNGFRIEAAGDTRWRTRRPGCLTGLGCEFDGEQAQELIAAMQDGGAYRFTFRDRNGQAQDLTWPLGEFGEAWADFLDQSRARGLVRQGG